LDFSAHHADVDVFGIRLSELIEQLPRPGELPVDRRLARPRQVELADILDVRHFVERDLRPSIGGRLTPETERAIQTDESGVRRERVEAASLGSSRFDGNDRYIGVGRRVGAERFARRFARSGKKSLVLAVTDLIDDEIRAERTDGGNERESSPGK